VPPLKTFPYIQFHPTGLFHEGNISFLITEALRGAGAVLRNQQGEAFMHLYDQRLALAPRDIVSRAILTEMRKNGAAFVFLDATQLSSELIDHTFSSHQFQLQGPAQY